MAQSVNITPVQASTFELQAYSPTDTALMNSFQITDTFNPSTDYIEYHVYGYDQNLYYSTNNAAYTIYNNQINIDPEQDVLDVFDQGSYYIVYNFLTRLANSSPDATYYISEISSDRTEIRLDTSAIPNTEVELGAQAIISKLQNDAYYYDFFLNFGQNTLIIANNMALDTSDPTNPTILVKLYEPLPANYAQYNELWIVENLREPAAFSVEIQTTFDNISVGLPIQGPNFNLNIANEVSIASTSTNLQELLSNTSTLGTGSLQYNLNSLLAEKGIELNIDYSNYNNFIHFSSAQTRLENFYYKLSLIEQYQATATLVTNDNVYTSGSEAIAQSKINEIITNFDGYEYYLYYTSASTAWPKTNAEPPFVNATTTSTLGTDWLADQLIIASDFDEANKDNLVYSIPPYLRDDPMNSQFELFIQMIGQHFDILWTYIGGITEKYNADNRLDYGISKDLVADALRDLGITIYQNNFSTQNIYSSLLGITSTNSLLNIPNTTNTLPAATGLEYIDTYVTASLTSSLVPLDDANKEIYKRIYHNIPYLLKKKGTTAGLRALINLYGIPDTILRINEFGGQDKINVNDWDNSQDTFNYALQLDPNNPCNLEIGWKPLVASGQTPKTIELRFKTSEFPPTNASQSIFTYENASIGLHLIYTGSGLTSGSYSGSTYDPYYQYATLKFVSGSSDPANSGTSASIYLPFFNGDWWSVCLTTSGSGPYTWTLSAAQKAESYVKYYQTSSKSFITNPNSSDNIIITSPSNVTSAYYLISGALQEFRYYTTQITTEEFKDYVMNPYSIEGSTSYNTLAFRAPLGTDLLATYTSTDPTSIHPSVTGSSPTASFDNSGDLNSLYYLSNPTWITNQEYVYQKQPNAGIKVSTSDKIRIENPIIPTGDTLSPYISIQQNLAISQSYTRDVNYTEAGFSPQDEINDDIIDQLGYFNFGDYIGDPRLESSSYTSYPDLNSLRDSYFKKYTKNYNIQDYVRLIKYLDNSLFKMIKDFVPARTGLASGVIIKQHLLERNRTRPAQVSWTRPEYTASVTTRAVGYATGSKIYTFTGATGGTLPYLTAFTSSFSGSTYQPAYLNISQSWSEQIKTISGSVTKVHNTLDEFYNGEFQGTAVTVTNGSLIDSDCEIFLDVNVAETDYIPVLYDYRVTSQSIFLSNVVPLLGEISIYYTDEEVAIGSPGRPGTIID